MKRRATCRLLYFLMFAVALMQVSSGWANPAGGGAVVGPVVQADPPMAIQAVLDLEAELEVEGRPALEVGVAAEQKAPEAIRWMQGQAIRTFKKPI